MLFLVRNVWRQTEALVHLDRLQHNIRLLKAKLSPGVQMMATVKADGYGHGAVEVSKAVLSAGANQLGVATVEEAVVLRQSGIEAPILVYGALPEQAANAVVDYDIMVTVAGAKDIQILADAANSHHRPVRVHLKLDTGMGRLGVRSIEEMLIVLSHISDASSIELEGMFTHLSSADQMHLADGRVYTEMQRRRFIEWLDAAKQAGYHVPIAHMANSAAILWGSEYHFDMVRPGIAMYGYHPALAWEQGIHLQPVLELRSTITRIARMQAGEAVSYGRTYVTDHEEWIATVAVGYADGIPRALANRAYVEVSGAVVPMVGTVCMDQLMINVTGIDAKVGDPVTIYSKRIESKASIQRHADLLDTIPYELLCRISSRVPRHYIL